MLAFYLIGYGTVRFFIEYFREPDAHLGFVFLSFSRGQQLCFLMILSGILIYGGLRWKNNGKAAVAAKKG
jgi:phosphatidylglycerol:prolipoprotein diacylglycerol transferase